MELLRVYNPYNTSIYPRIQASRKGGVEQNFQSFKTSINIY